MRIDSAIGTDVLERMLSAYGFSMQKELAEHLGIAKSNVAGWVQRGQVPGNAIVQCSLDTGVDVSWLVTGQLEKASSLTSDARVYGKPLYDEMLSNGGKPVLRRILDAYGFTMQKQLCDLLGISSGTVSTWIRREYFPGDVVVACALDTGVSLLWLATGKGRQREDAERSYDMPGIPRKNLIAGELVGAGEYSIDLSMFPHPAQKPVTVFGNSGSWVIDESITDISNGRWLLGIDDKHDIYDVTLLPGRKINVSNKGSTFSCGVDEINIAGKVLLTMEYNF